MRSSHLTLERNETRVGANQRPATIEPRREITIPSSVSSPSTSLTTTNTRAKTVQLREDDDAFGVSSVIPRSDSMTLQEDWTSPQTSAASNHLPTFYKPNSLMSLSLEDSPNTISLQVSTSGALVAPINASLSMSTGCGSRSTTMHHYGKGQRLAYCSPLSGQSTPYYFNNNMRRTRGRDERTPVLIIDAAEPACTSNDNDREQESERVMKEGSLHYHVSSAPHRRPHRGADESQYIAVLAALQRRHEEQLNVMETRLSTMMIQMQLIISKATTTIPQHTDSHHAVPYDSLLSERDRLMDNKKVKEAQRVSSAPETPPPRSRLVDRRFASLFVHVIRCCLSYCVRWWLRNLCRGEGRVQRAVCTSNAILN